MSRINNNNISFYDTKNNGDYSNISVPNDMFKFNKIKKDNGQTNIEENGDNLDYTQKQYLENYKTFLSGIDYKLNNN